jgi:hypothetical protein
MTANYKIRINTQTIHTYTHTSKNLKMKGKKYDDVDKDIVVVAVVDLCTKW